MYGSEQQRAMSMPTVANPPLLEINAMYNGEAGVQQEDFEQF